MTEEKLPYIDRFQVHGPDQFLILNIVEVSEPTRPKEKLTWKRFGRILLQGILYVAWWLLMATIWLACVVALCAGIAYLLVQVANNLKWH
jgi:hypothetical protein